MSVRILIGDCREKLRELPNNSVDSCVCDPPYHLTSIVKRFGSASAAPAKVGKTGAYARASKGFMGQTWDGGDVAFDPETWAEVLRVLKPGGHLVAFSGTRTYHRMVCAIEDAGFEIRDCIFYCYGSGFPKSHSINKALHGKELVCDCGSPQVPQHDLRVVRGVDVSTTQSLHEEQENLLLSRLPEQGLPKSGAAWPKSEPSGTEEPSVEGWSDLQESARELSGREVCARTGVGAADGADERLHHGTSASDGADVRLPADADGSGQPQGSQSGEQRPSELGTVADQRGPQTRGSWPRCGGCGKPIVPEGIGTALKPAVEPICLARKPISEKNVAANVLAHGTGAINIDGCRIEASGRPHIGNHAPRPTDDAASSYDLGSGFSLGKTDLGRWPANLIHDGSEEVVAGFPDELRARGNVSPTKRQTAIFGQCEASEGATDGGDSGSAARFFYCAKATSDERGEGNNHPTVKPVALMQWLVRLVTPKGGLVLDPFMGSGSTGLACDAEQMDFIGCELSPEYAAIAERRIRDAAGMFAEVMAA